MSVFEKLPAEVFDNIMKYLSPEQICTLGLTSRNMNSKIHAPYTIFWKDLFLMRYDSPNVSKGIDWKWLFQARHWVELVVRRGNAEFIQDERSPCFINPPHWKTCFLRMVSLLSRELNVKKDTRNLRHLEASKLIGLLRSRRQDSQFTAFLTISLSSNSHFHLNLSSTELSAIRKVVYVTKTSCLFINGTPNFSVFLTILNFIQYNLSHYGHLLGPDALDVMGWEREELQGDFAFQPRDVITKHDFTQEHKRIEGDWVGFIGGLAWEDLEALVNPVVSERNPKPPIQDLIIGPQRLIIRMTGLDHTSASSNSNQRITICGEGYGNSSRHFTINGELRKMYLDGEIDKGERQLFWRTMFVQTYVAGDDTGFLWSYDGMYCPGSGIIGRWRDGREPEETAVTGPFWLWRRSTYEIS